MNYPVPITKLPIIKDKWLNTLIKYEKDYYIKDIIENICQKTYQWILSKNDLILISDYESFQSDFIDMIIQNYNSFEYFFFSILSIIMSEYFELKYLEEINELFNEHTQFINHLFTKIPNWSYRALLLTAKKRDRP